MKVLLESKYKVVIKHGVMWQTSLNSEITSLQCDSSMITDILRSKIINVIPSVTQISLSFRKNTRTRGVMERVRGRITFGSQHTGIETDAVWSLQIAPHR